MLLILVTSSLALAPTWQNHLESSISWAASSQL